MMSEEEVLALLDSCSNAGRWGADDELGTLNFITPAKRQQASRLVREGISIGVGKDINFVVSRTNPDPAIRRMLYVRHVDPFGCSDTLEIAPHGWGTTHLDAVGHIYHDGRMYNGRMAADEVTDQGMQFGSIMGSRDGIVTRGVLLDVAAARGVPWLTPDQGVTPEDLDKAEDLAGVRVEPGDAVFVRVGLAAREVVEGEEDPAVRAGLTPECLPWLHRKEVAVYSGDCTEQWPSPYPQMFLPLHMIGMSAMGLAMLDNPRLDELTTLCHDLGRYAFMVVVAPLRIPGGTASAVNPICLL